MTPHLLKKKYWEDKARDLRDENDNLCAVNESLVRTRIPSAGIWDQDLNLNPKNKRILRYDFCFFLIIILFIDKRFSDCISFCFSVLISLFLFYMRIIS